MGEPNKDNSVAIVAIVAIVFGLILFAMTISDRSEPTPTPEPINTPTPTATPTKGEVSTSTPTTQAVAQNPTSTETATYTPVPSDTPTATVTPTETATSTSTASPTDVPSATSSPTATETPIPTDTPTSTHTPSVTPSLTATVTPMPAATHTLTATATVVSTGMANLDWVPDTDLVEGNGLEHEMAFVPWEPSCILNNTGSENCEDFYIDVHEVTNEQYKACVDEGQCYPPSDPESGWRQKDYPDGGAKLPVVWVDINMARQYCRWAIDGDLPTEEEWDWAARGPNEWVYPWGNEFEESRVIFDKASPQAVNNTTDISWSGVEDLAGNVKEWTRSIYTEDQFSPETVITFEEVPSNSRIVVRGGAISSRDESNINLNSDRENKRSDYEYHDVGFRCVRP